MKDNVCVVLAAGDGKRMKSARPKVLMELLGEPMLAWVLDAAENAGTEKIGVVIGNNAHLVEEFLTKRAVGKYETFLQSERKGTGHAVLQAMELIHSARNVLVLCGDAPLIDSDTITKALEFHISQNNDVTVLSAQIDNPTGYGRIIRENGEFTAITEHKDCTDEQRRINEINSGVYWFSATALEKALPMLNSDNANGEFYLTDTVEIIRRNGGKAGAYTAENRNIVKGANSRRDLLELNTYVRMRIIGEHLDNGVSFPCTDGIIIGKDVRIGMDTEILPNTMILGNTTIGNGSAIGANSLIVNCTIGNNVVLNNVQAHDSVIDDGAKVGPFVHLRPNTHLHENVKIGDFVEVKNSEIGEKTSIAHLTYIGDADVGRGVNFGCGCVTANFDGINKYRTVIGDDAFIGCNTNLIAPVTIGENSATAAGSTITQNVPANALSIERGRQVNKENWKMNLLRPKK